MRQRTPRGRSREGAWIEILSASYARSPPAVAPARERGLKLRRRDVLEDMLIVAPARERGLKYADADI